MSYINEKGCKKILDSILSLWNQQEDFNFFIALMSHQFAFVFHHSQRVAYYAVLLGDHVGCNSRDVARIGAAALLHDIGKVNVPGAILYKQGVYNQYERAEIERHPLYGSQMLLRSKQLAELAQPVLCHHERWDGTGYPYRLRGKEISLAARIIHITEAFDVMTTIQNYQKQKSPEEAFAEMKRLSGSQFDESLVAAFINLESKLLVANSLPAGSAATRQQGDGESEETPGTFLDKDGIVHYLENVAALGIVCLDKMGKVVFCNGYAEKIRNLPPGSLLGRNFLDNYPPHRQAILSEKLKQLCQGDRTDWYRLMERNGEFIENRYSRVTDKDGNFIGTVLVTTDVTKREKIAHGLSSALERQAAMYEAAQLITSAASISEIMEGILSIIKRTMLVNQVVIYLLNDETIYPPAAHSDYTIYKECIYQLKQECEQVVETLQETLKPYSADDPVKNMTKFYIPLVYRKSVLGVLLIQRPLEAFLDKNRQELLETLASQAAIALRNIKLYEEVTYLAEYDKLTGLLNRHSFEKIYEEQCQKAKVHQTPLTALMIDIDGLKKVNDQHGHLAGDLVIQATAQVVKSSIRNNDYAFRYGGDEIVVLMPSITLVQAEIVIKRINHNIKLWRKEKVQYKKLNLSISIGAADSNQVGFNNLIQEADKKMYENKQVYYKSLRA